jgi:hypothetical protein
MRPLTIVKGSPNPLFSSAANASSRTPRWPRGGSSGASRDLTVFRQLAQSPRS